MTLMAVTLATALLSALLAVAGTAQTRVLSQIADGGPLASISVSPAAPDPTQAGLDNPRSGPPRDLTAQALARIRALPHVRSVVPVTATRVVVVPPALPPQGVDSVPAAGCLHAATPATAMNQIDRSGRSIPSLSASTSANSGDLPVSLLSGRFPAVNATDQVDVSQDYVNHLGLPKAKAAEVVGTRIMIGSTRFAGTESAGAPAGRSVAVVAFRWTTATIVGVVQQEAAPGDVLAWPPLAQRTLIGWNPAGPSGTATPRPLRTCRHWSWPISWRTSSPFGRRSRRLATRAARRRASSPPSVTISMSSRSFCRASEWWHWPSPRSASQTL